MDKSLLLLCFCLMLVGSCAAQQRAPSLYEKFGWKAEATRDSIKKLKAGLPSGSEFLGEWEKTLDFDFYKQSVPDRFSKLIGDTRFKWAVYVDVYYRGDFGAVTGARFLGETDDGRLLILGRDFRGQTHGTLLGEAEWKRFAELRDVEKYFQLTWSPLINLRRDDDVPPNHDEAIALYFFHGGKTRQTLAVTLADGDKDDAISAQISALRALQAAFRFANPEVNIPLRLTPP